jgi:hypothetical protein
MRTVSALERIAHHSSKLPGRTSLVWHASSFPFTFQLHQLNHRPTRSHSVHSSASRRLGG